MDTNTTAAQRQEIRGACPATGRSASVCADQAHAGCWEGQRGSEALDLKVEAEHRRLDGTY